MATEADVRRPDVERNDAPHAQLLPDDGEQFRLLLANVQDVALVFLDSDGKVLRWSPAAARLFGYEAAEVVGQNFSCFFSAEDQARQLASRELSSALEFGSETIARWHVRKDGTQFWGCGQTVVLRHAGVPRHVSTVRDLVMRGFVRILADRSEERRAQQAVSASEVHYRELAERLADALRRKDQFLAILSHELRNPLAPILTALQLLRQGQLNTPIQSQARDIVERQVRQLTRLIDDLLDASRLSAGKIQLHCEPIDLAEIAERAAEGARPTIEGGKQKLAVELRDRPVWVQGDAVRLEQVILNLLNNAAKYTPEGGNIWLELGEDEHQAVLRVRDSGVGIAADVLPRVFELFTQAEATLDRSKGGLGIGLTLVRGLIELHGGIVQAASPGADKGSEFTVRLPLVESPRPKLQVPALPRGLSTKSLRLLVVDDNIDAAESLAILLRQVGHTVTQAYTGPEAIAKALSARPHVMLLDIGLPGMDGYEVAKAVRLNPPTKDIVIVAVTGFGQEADRRGALAAGCQYHLVKPIDPEHLINLLSKLANLRSVQDLNGGS